MIQNQNTNVDEQHKSWWRSWFGPINNRPINVSGDCGIIRSVSPCRQVRILLTGLGIFSTWKSWISLFEKRYSRFMLAAFIFAHNFCATVCRSVLSTSRNERQHFPCVQMQLTSVAEHWQSPVTALHKIVDRGHHIQHVSVKLRD
jgi:hypothetical protein